MIIVIRPTYTTHHHHHNERESILYIIQLANVAGSSARDVYADVTERRPREGDEMYTQVEY